ncbi:T9SS-dependent M36 family metallopeptidase [Flavobacterium glaciei]|nr:T9SS-dependent M36 family metallopeptidase [Flavobacterium glaciei]
MKKILLFVILVLPCFIFCQSNSEIIKSYLKSPSARAMVSSQSLQDWVIQSEAPSGTTGITNCFVVQRYQGIEIFRSISNFYIKDGKVIGHQERVVSDLNKKIYATKPSLAAPEAAAKVYFQLGLPLAGNFQIKSHPQPNSYTIITGVSNEEPIVANLVYHQSKSGDLKLAWDMTIPTADHDKIWSVRVDALTGKILEKINTVINCSFDHKGFFSSHNHLSTPESISYNQIFTPVKAQVQAGTYRVLPFQVESPIHGNFQLVSNPANSIASPFGWHDIDGNNGAEFTTTRGNNVWAKEDFESNNSLDGYSPEGGNSLLFDFPYGGTSVNASSYIDAACTNLFYMNNIMHDVWYQYGFNEASGNFQQNNYGRGGTAADYVFADAQDGSVASPPRINNANFSTPVDGSSPRMQMFLWNTTPSISPVIITAPSILAGTYGARQNAFNPGKVDLPVAPEFLQSNLALYIDNSGAGSLGCSAPSNAAALNGKIVVLYRGSCNFVAKAKFAQDAGAIAVIIVNNVQGEVNMSGADESIAIPVISITKALGDSIIEQMQSGAVNVKLQLESSSFVNSDGDFDNGIIAHEYGHGISTRLAGGRNNSRCLDNTDQMGEGWSDWFALMMQLKPGDVGTAKRGIGTFVSSQKTDGVGIRSFPYSTDTSVNPMTYGVTNSFQFINAENVEETSVHGVGSVWATMLWDLTWAYINKYGYDDNKYTGKGGNNKVMQLVLDGLKLQPCSPTFIDGRNAIIAADQAITGGKDFCLIWEVFAARGLGVNASAGDNNVGNDQAEDFTTPAAGANCTLGTVDINQENVMRVYPNPSTGNITVRINNYNGLVTVNVVGLNGRIVYSEDKVAFSNEKSFDLSQLSAGIYMIDITGEALKYVEKIIIN